MKTSWTNKPKKKPLSDEEKKRRAKLYREKNKEKIKARQDAYWKKYYANNREKLIEKNSEYSKNRREQNPELIKSQREKSKKYAIKYAKLHKKDLIDGHTKEYREKRGVNNKKEWDEIKRGINNSRVREYYKNNKSKFIENVKRYNQSHAEKVKERRRNYRKKHIDEIRKSSIERYAALPEEKKEELRAKKREYWRISQQKKREKLDTN